MKRARNGKQKGGGQSDEKEADEAPVPKIDPDLTALCPSAICKASMADPRPHRHVMKDCSDHKFCTN